MHKDLNAETMLKYCFVVQQARVTALLEFEKQTKFVLPNGHKELAVLKEIAAEVRKFEVGEAYLQGKLHYSGPYPGGLVSGNVPTDTSGLTERLSKLSSVDRHLLVATTETVTTCLRFTRFTCLTKAVNKYPGTF